MKTSYIIFLALALGLMPAGRSFGQAPAATPAKAAPVFVPPRSVFTQPASPRDGRDPFFPESSGVYDRYAATTHASAENATTLAVKGYSVSNGRPIVIINNHSFMAGDEGDVLSGSSRAHIRCLEIRPGTVVVEVNGARHEIHF